MFPIIPTLLAAKTSLDMLQKARQWLRPTKALTEAESALAQRFAGDLGSLQEQVHRQHDVIVELVAQLKADQALLEQHNDVLISMSQTLEQIMAAEIAQRRWVICALGLASVAFFASVLHWVLR